MLLPQTVIANCIDELATSVNKSSKSEASHFEFWLVALDYSRAVSDTAQLEIFTCGDDKNFNLIAEKAACDTLKDTIKPSDLLE
jgi:hypothetical protein